jgi:hypothetical protein
MSTCILTSETVQLDADERNSLAWRDGFRSRGHDEAFAEMMEFWAGRLPFRGHIIHWRYTKLLKKEPPRRQQIPCGGRNHRRSC